MKRKFFSVLLALVLMLSFSLVTATPAAGADTLSVIPYTLGPDTHGTSVWSTVEKHSGSSSALLTHTTGTGSVYVEFVPTAGETLSTFQADITAATPDWSFWHFLENTGVTNGPQFELYFDDPDSTGWLEVTAVGLQGTTGTDGWLEETLAGATLAGFGGNTPNGGSVFEWGPLTALSGIQTAVNAAWETAETGKVATNYVLTRVRVELWEDIDQDCYIDDIQISGTTYNLEGTAADYSTIQSAIDAASAGDTISVAAGTYSERVEVTESLTLEGAGSSLVTVTSPDFAVAAFTVRVSDVDISGFTAIADGLASIYLDAVSGCTISDNVLAGNYDGIFLKTGSHGNTFTGNVASNQNQGFSIEFSDNNTFTNNIANGNAKYGFYVEDGEENTFTGNTANQNTRNGFRFVDGETNTLNYNNIVGNILEGVKQCGSSLPAVDLDATNNWWGNASGPADAVKFAATGYTAYGDNVTANVDYEPWLLAVVVTDVTPTTYEKTLALKNNWTLVSTDKEVTSGNWTAVVAYKYTAGSGYTEVPLVTQLTSVDAYYIKTSGGGGVGINYSTDSPGVVTKTLSAGWNVISCAAETDAYELLSPLRYAQIGEQEGTGLTSLVGQASYNQYLATTFSNTLVTDNEWLAITPNYTQLTLNAFDGYWVYMNAAKSFGVIPD